MPAVPADQQRHVVPANGQRMARFHDLDAVGAFDREPCISAVKKIHGLRGPFGATPGSSDAHGLSEAFAW